MSRADGADLRSDLRRLEELRVTFGPAAARERRAIVTRLSRAPMARPGDLLRFHEALLFARAYPDDAATLRVVERALRGFASRPDLAAMRGKLEDSGLAGADIRFRFFAATALRLATRWPERA